MYQHRDWQGALLDFPVNKVVCVGSNYAEHIKEMGSITSVEPVLFIKPETALCDIRQPVAIPKEFGTVHHEVELAVLIGTPLKQANEDRAARAIAGYGVALDLTLRELQARLKKAGQPWEKAKAFDGSCPISGFIPVAEFGDAQQAELSLSINDEIRQQGNTRDMITPILPLICYISRFFTLRPGDIILTGTPQGVGPMASGDMLKIGLNGKTLSTRVL
ncbi:TPA: fumarylacetoacetate hydrolase family protein [Yersinia enterocolitica]|uniref:fumarylacetoacetate hydrolase family protein n=1 Tax=Yersinia enterocolitica TaxID=630 RepID=UPI000657B2CA|nr:fumarylacetoacetate hydrolase family protein [Yersinia enterocolitica]EKN3847039.1 fumarylacetoacetate hydrolase family protein [Yersinia enterocolitica]EKN4800238.1 fumarylacetoacetate hydrolase family protein [Yersinia enterocolitica]EKN4847170.1 fumarylacetoacetate hydrolase family protein [Yersinia enterocolitica]EKN4921561.1 fumarylacetoacetate hydrolase family protein [Yersinia enterocolitica]EKN5118502.1 fumarylacetoacetate hydrolase family protein [Yersinia enterocolitica]